MFTAEEFIDAATIIVYVLIGISLFSLVNSAISFLIIMSACFILGAVAIIIIEF